MHTIHIPEGTVVLSEGEINLDLYRILSGHAELYTGYSTPGETILGILSSGSYFGELGMLTQKPSMYTVIAYSDLEILRIAPENLEKYFQEKPRDAVDVMKHMAESMYNLKANLDMMISELEVKQADRTAQLSYMRRQIAKYNMGGIPAALQEFPK